MDRQTDRQTDRQIDRQTYIYIDRQAGRGRQTVQFSYPPSVDALRWGYMVIMPSPRPRPLNPCLYKTGSHSTGPRPACWDFGPNDVLMIFDISLCIGNGLPSAVPFSPHSSHSRTAFCLLVHSVPTQVTDARTSGIHGCYCGS